jgi:hypothetical protein
MTNTSVTINFYGLKRFDKPGKHPNEQISEGEEFIEMESGEEYAEIERRAKYLADLWGMDVFCTDSQNSLNGTHYYKGNFFKWHK